MSEATFVAVVVLGAAALGVVLFALYRLVVVPPPGTANEREPEPDDLVIIATGGEAELSIMAAKLEGAGLAVLTRDRTTSVYPTGLGWELLVRHGDHQGARRILDLD